MNALKSLTFTTLPTQGANPIFDRRTKVIARLEEQKLILKDPELHPNKSEVGKEGRRKGDGRAAAARAVVVATTSERQLCVVCSKRVEAHRVRKRQTRNRGFGRSINCHQ